MTEDQPINGAAPPDPTMLYEVAKQRFTVSYLRSLPQQNGQVAINPLELAVNLRLQQVIIDLILTCLMQNGLKADAWQELLTNTLTSVAQGYEQPKLAVPVGRVLRPV